MASQTARRIRVCADRFLAADTEATGLSPHGPWRRIRYDFGVVKEGRRTVGRIEENRDVCPARAFAFSFADMDGQTTYFRLPVDPMTRNVDYDSKVWKAWKPAVQDVLEDERITKVLHNPRYDLLLYEKAGVRVRGRVIDTQILAHIATAGAELTYALKPLSKKYVDYDDGDEKALRTVVHRLRAQAKKLRWAYATQELAGRDPWKADMWMAGDDVVQPYADGDVTRCILLMHLWYDEVMRDARMRSLFEREHELMWTLKDMEDTGVRVFPDTVRELKTFYLDYQQKQVAVADANGGRGLNYESTVQMSAVFYEQRGHEPVYTETWNKKANRFNYSLNGDQLVRMATGYVRQERRSKRVWDRKVRRWREQHVYDTVHVPPDPLAKAVLEFKAAGQTIGSFLDVYARYWVPESWEDLDPDMRRCIQESGGRPNDYYVHVLHPGYKQTGTITGRLSCADPNLMQVASETTGRRKADIQSRPREGFGPRPRCVWYLPDYSQIEVWLFAFMSGEERMQEALLSGRDFHGTIAENVFGSRSDFKENKSYYRKCAKLIMFAKLYGGGVNKMAGLLKMPVDQAKRFIEDYEAELPGVRRFMSQMMNRASRDGVIYNPFGRRYEFDPHFAYKSVNYLIQGTAADVMKNALVNVHRMLRNKWPGVKLLLTIHDEIVVEAPLVLHSKQLMRDIVKEMQRDSTTLGLPVPLPVGMKIVKCGERWNKTIEIDKTHAKDPWVAAKAA